MAQASGADQYWNPVLETLPREKLSELQLVKFKRILHWAYDQSKFHRRFYQEAGLEPGDIRTWDDVAKVPKVEKAMMRAIQGKDPFPYGDILCVPLERVTEFHQTSGTTGQPVYQPDTWQDWEWQSECWSYIMYAQGFRDTDRIFIPFGYNIFIAYWCGHYAGEKIGCEVVPGGALDTEARILKMQELKATALMATPTYVLSMAEKARAMGIDPAQDLSIGKILCAGEPGASIPSTRKRIEDAWGAKVYDHAGATEIGAWSYECTAQSGGLHVNEALFLVELEDTHTGELITEPGKRGKLVITAFDRQAQPCIRFDSKDIAEWAGERCPCGRSFRLVKGGVVGRADDITKVKGVLLAPSAIEEVVRGFRELGDEFQVEVATKGDLDDITLRVELLPEEARNRQSVEARLVEQLRLKTSLRYNITFLDCGSLPRCTQKAERFKDLRAKHEEGRP
jgi:phenylacetate-CoA ligase